MPWLSINGINAGLIAAVGNSPTGDRRDIGETSEAGDGSMRITRQTRKRDLKFSTVPLTSAVALAWEGLVTGEGESWSFDSSPYGSKGLGPSSTDAYSIIAGGAKYGAGLLRLPATTGTFTLAGALLNSVQATPGWTACIWRLETAVWHHYIVRSDGAKFFDGVTSGLATTWLAAGGAPAPSDGVRLANTGGSAQDYDDLVVLPYKIPDSWAPAIFAAGAAFSPLPFLNATGSLVNEQGTRRVIGSCSESVLVASSGGARTPDMKQLQIELKAA